MQSSTALVRRTLHNVRPFVAAGPPIAADRSVSATARENSPRWGQHVQQLIRPVIGCGARDRNPRRPRRVCPGPFSDSRQPRWLSARRVRRYCLRNGGENGRRSTSSVDLPGDRRRDRGRGCTLVGSHSNPTRCRGAGFDPSTKMLRTVRSSKSHEFAPVHRQCSAVYRFSLRSKPGLSRE